MVFDIPYVKIDHPVVQITILQGYILDQMEHFSNIVVTRNLIFEQSIHMANKFVV